MQRGKIFKDQRETRNVVKLLEKQTKYNQKNLKQTNMNMCSLLHSGFTMSGHQSQLPYKTLDTQSKKINTDYSKGRETLQALYPEVYSIMDELCSAMVKLTVEFENKPVNNINKQFQDCIMNYFFEDFVGALIIDKFPHRTKTHIREQYDKKISDNKLALKSKRGVSAPKNKKYMLLPQLYINEIRSQGKEEKYTDFLRDLAIEKIHHREGEVRWRSQIRKKTFAVILLVHFFNDAPVQSIFEMWAHTFPKCEIQNQNPSKERQKKSQKRLGARSNCFGFEQIKAPLLTKKYQFNHYSANFLLTQGQKHEEFVNDQQNQASQNFPENSQYGSIGFNQNPIIMTDNFTDNEDHSNLDSSQELSASKPNLHFLTALPSSYQQLQQSKDEQVLQTSQIQIPLQISQQHIFDHNCSDDSELNEYLKFPLYQPHADEIFNEDYQSINEQDNSKADFSSLDSKIFPESSSEFTLELLNNKNQLRCLNQPNQFAFFSNTIQFEVRNPASYY